MSNKAKTIHVQARRQAIIDELERSQRLSVQSLSDLLKVSSVTIRADLRALEARGLLIRTHGGAALPKVPGHETAFDQRLDSNEAEKRAIGAAAAAMVKPHYTIALDGSTTCLAITPFLQNLENLIVVTNSLVIAQQFLDAPSVRVLLPAGELRRDSISIIGAPETLPDVNLNLGFFGAHGVTLSEGVTEISEAEGEIKTRLIARSLESYIVVDHSKWGCVGPYTYAAASDVGFITTASAPESEIDAFQQAGVPVILAEAE